MSDFNLILEKGDQFYFQKNANSQLPTMFKDVELDDGYYSYGIASTQDADIFGEKIIIPDEVARGLEIPPFNKSLVNHDKNDISTGIIKFSRIVPINGKDYHVILEKVNDKHPKFESIWGSMKNGNLDAYSIAGYTSQPIRKFNPEIGKVEAIRKAERFEEVSKVSMPANPNAKILGTFHVEDGNYFKKNMAGGILINNQKKEDKTMGENFVTIEQFNGLSSQFGELQKSIADSLTKNTEQFKSFEDRWQKIEKQAMTEEEMKKKKMMEEEAMKKSATNPDEELIKQVSQLTQQNQELTKGIQTIEKKLSERKSMVNNDNPLRIQKSADAMGNSPDDLHLFNMVMGRGR